MHFMSHFTEPHERPWLYNWWS